MSYPATQVHPTQFVIGLVAYGVDGPDPSLVLVRVPSERGRWVMTDRCVVEFPCPHCNAVVGEPCRRGNGNNRLKHGAGTHWKRRDLWQRERFNKRRSAQPKLRVPAANVAEARSEISEE